MKNNSSLERSWGGHYDYHCDDHSDDEDSHSGWKWLAGLTTGSGAAAAATGG